MIALEAQDLDTFYGKSHILHGVSLEVREGEIVALLGRNGAGKTTTLRSLIGLTRPRTGKVAVFGAGRDADFPLTGSRGWRRLCAGGASHLRQPDGGREPAGSGRAARPVDGRRVSTRCFRALPSAAGTRARQLSGGEQEMLSIARALLLNPKLLMLDEPSQGLAPLIVEDVFRIIAAARREGLSVLLVEQNVRAAVEIADRAYVLDDGRIVYEGDARAFGADEQRVRELAGASAEKWDIDG